MNKYPLSIWTICDIFSLSIKVLEIIQFIRVGIIPLDILLIYFLKSSFIRSNSFLHSSRWSWIEETNDSTLKCISSLMVSIFELKLSVKPFSINKNYKFS